MQISRANPGNPRKGGRDEGREERREGRRIGGRKDGWVGWGQELRETSRKEGARAKPGKQLALFILVQFCVGLLLCVMSTCQ